MTYAIGKGVGFIIGITVGIIFCVLIFKKLNNNNKVKTEYDERQKAVRGQGFTLAFWTLSAYLFILMILDIMEISVPAVDAIKYFAGFIIASSVLCVHNIVYGAYFGTNSISARWTVFLVAFIILNGYSTVRAFMHGELIVDGKVTLIATCPLSMILLLTAVIALGIKKLQDNKECVDEES